MLDTHLVRTGHIFYIYEFKNTTSYGFIQVYTDLRYLTYIHFIHYWTKNVILMHDIDKIIIDITFK